MKTLQEIYKNYCGPDGWGDKGTAHTYIDIYSEILKPYRIKSNILEIGIYYGHSLSMWCEYFEQSTIVGVDIVNNINMDKVKFKPIFCDATSPTLLEHLKYYPNFDVIIDDGSHILEHQLATYNILKNKLSKNGIYIIEDVANFDTTRKIFENLDYTKNIHIIDNRHIKNRYDDVLIIIKNK